MQRDKDLTREAMADSGGLPEQQDNETAQAEEEESLRSLDADSMDTCISFNTEYARVYDIPN